MTDIALTVEGATAAQAQLSAFGQQIPGSVRTEMNRIVIGLAAYIKDAKLSGEVLNVRTGDLRRSIFSKVENDGGNISGSVYTRSKYARQREFGGTIRPVNAQFLTIPMPAALTPSGVMKYPRPRDYPDTFVDMVGMMIRQRQGPGMSVPLFKLRNQVYQPPRSFMNSSLEDKRSEIEARLSAAIRSAMS